MFMILIRMITVSIMFLKEIQKTRRVCRLIKVLKNERYFNNFSKGLVIGEELQCKKYNNKLSQFSIKYTIRFSRVK